MKLYVCMILSGSICTLAYLIFNRILPYEMSLKWMRLIFAALVVFCLLSVGGLFLYGRIYRQFIRRSEISDDNWRMESKRLWRKIRIGYSPLASPPVTVGMIRPVILFPSGMNWSIFCAWMFSGVFWRSWPSRRNGSIRWSIIWPKKALR